nr:hypothetical protein [Candidatus Omnitrophota bacterium]
MPCAKFRKLFSAMTVMGVGFLFLASPARAEKVSGKILDLLGSNIKAEVDSDVALNLEGEAVLTYRSGTGDALLGIYRIINISGRLFTAEVISNNINPTVGMQIFIANASSINPAVLEKKVEPETAGASKTIKG